MVYLGYPNGPCENASVPEWYILTLFFFFFFDQLMFFFWGGGGECSFLLKTPKSLKEAELKDAEHLESHILVLGAIKFVVHELWLWGITSLIFICVQKLKRLLLFGVLSAGVSFTSM